MAQSLTKVHENKLRYVRCPVCLSSSFYVKKKSGLASCRHCGKEYIIEDQLLE